MARDSGSTNSRALALQSLEEAPPPPALERIGTEPVLEEHQSNEEVSISRIASARRDCWDGSKYAPTPLWPWTMQASFPEVASDADTKWPSWRTGLHSDWQLVVGPTIFKVHKVLTGHGPRASSFLCSAFTTGASLVRQHDSDAIATTDLSFILPEPVWPFFCEVLDFIYTGDLKLSDINVIPLLRCADALQIKSLFQCCVGRMNELLTIASAPSLLGDTARLLGSWTLAEQITLAAEEIIVANFDRYSAQDLKRIPVNALVRILQRDDLNAIHENEVFDRVLGIVQELNSDTEEEEQLAAMTRTESSASSFASMREAWALIESRLWQTVRLGALSNSYTVKAAQIDAIPKAAIIRSKMLHRRCGGLPVDAASLLDCWGATEWPVEPPRPRRPLLDLVCAVMYSVDTDARFDQDVERNITSATLVAEEIEYLGGRAILENIFGRPRGAGSEEDPINMEEVDVAFVLAPWTPSSQRIAWLMSFIDRGGAAVLLSFIGGLSKGAWLEGQYEPLLTGKVVDNTPYKDVHLAIPPVLAARPSLKRSVDSPNPPRILSGVDCINGRRRITSEMVQGAKVLAQWSDWQPLVVQHPTKNVFSISQRVSRIFERDDELGHDDTLQLVLNVMIYAGQIAQRNRRPKPQGEGAPGTAAAPGAAAATATANVWL